MFFAFFCSQLSPIAENVSPLGGCSEIITGFDTNKSFDTKIQNLFNWQSGDFSSKLEINHGEFGIDAVFRRAGSFIRPSGLPTKNFKFRLI